jgi:hypothetical protein
MYVVEKQNLKTDYRQLVGVYDSRDLADAGGEESLEMNDPDNWNITVTIVPLNNKLG